MSTLRTGIDLIEIDRFCSAFQRYEQRLLQRLFTAQELAENGVNLASLAARFAAKEAIVKAFGTGIGHITWKDMEIQRGPSGEPVLRLYGPAQELASQLGLIHCALSLSHTQNYAIAVVVMMGE